MSHITRLNQQTPVLTRHVLIRRAMRRISLVEAVAVLLVMMGMPLSGCVIQIGTGSEADSGDESSSGSDSNSDTSTGPVDPLPEPSVWRVDPPVLTLAQQKRKDEVDQFLALQYQAQGWHIVDTTQTFLGDVLDWLDPASVEGSQEEPPPEPSPEELLPAGGQGLQLTELDVFPELRGPDGSIPVVRPHFALYISGLSGAISLDDFLTNHVVPGGPTGSNRLYAGIGSLTPNRGASVWINAFAGLIEPGTLSVLEMVTGCRKNGLMWQQIGIAASRDWTANGLLSGNFGDWLLRIQVEFLTAGDAPQALGHSKGGWDGIVNGFVPAAGRTAAPGLIVFNPSVIGGPQSEALFQIRFLKGNWWVGWNGKWLGYYPATLFNEMSAQACEVHWYGEVYDPKATPTAWTWTDMGSGEFASAGFGYAANFRNPAYFDPSGISQWPANVGNFKEVNDACYTSTNLSAGQPPWDRSFFLGGPGGDAPNGDCP